MQTTQRSFEAAREIKADLSDYECQDVLLDFITKNGWTWSGDTSVVLDRKNQPHYISAKFGFAEQVYEVYLLHKDLIRLGML